MLLDVDNRQQNKTNAHLLSQEKSFGILASQVSSTGIVAPITLMIFIRLDAERFRVHSNNDFGGDLFT